MLVPHQSGGMLIDALLATTVVSFAMVACLQTGVAGFATQHELLNQVTAMRLHADAREPALYSLTIPGSWSTTEQIRLRQQAAQQLPQGDIDFSGAAPVVQWAGTALLQPSVYPARAP